MHCPRQEPERRERTRGDRPPGLAAQQLAPAHSHGAYGIECYISRAARLRTPYQGIHPAHAHTDRLPKTARQCAGGR
ncbi:chloramphenicol phosphotransferase CPT family protein [Streptomyces sp. NBC_01136]|uniref:phosphotransferase-like protein n=1 Tax=unclassified Streptomyces TaxID=2593676 RepID=UPI003254D538|nr:chloramphenicol phosphotransferase CPT family protein [Streptomyces sp. NBC_01136]